jgi:hypothetical protein
MALTLNCYELNQESENFYWFISYGSNGNILKGVFLSPADISVIENPYNLGLADYINEEWTDKNITDNNDTRVVMETVAAVVLDYTSKYHERSIYVRGNTETKRRLYQRFVSNSLNSITEIFHIYGKEYGSDEFEPFVKGKIYEALLVERL